MKINLNGTLEFDKGEKFPFICPKCKWPIEYDEKVVMVRCNHCNFIGTLEEFDNNFEEHRCKEGLDGNCYFCGKNLLK